MLVRYRLTTHIKCEGEVNGAYDDFDATADGDSILIRTPNPDAYARGIDEVLNGFGALRNRSGGGR